MRAEIKALHSILSETPVGASYAKLLLEKMHPDLERELVAMLEYKFQEMESIPSLKKELDGAKEYVSRVKVMIAHMPSAFLLFSLKLHETESTQKFARLFLTAKVNHLLYAMQEEQKHFRDLLFSINPNDDGDSFREKTNKPENKAYFPRFLYLHLNSLARLILTFKSYEQLAEKVEALFIVQGLYGIFYRYYFDLISNLHSDSIAKVFEELFTGVFVALRKYEVQEFYQKTPNIKKLQYLIEKDAQGSRHPVLRKHVFTAINNFNPLFQDGSNLSTNVAGQRILQRQLESLNQLGTERSLRLFRLVKKLRGKNFLMYMLVNIQRTGKEKIFELQKDLAASDNPEDKEVLQIVEGFVAKMGSRVKMAERKGPKLVQSHTSQRLEHAQANILANKDRKMMDHTQVSQYLEERLKKLYERVKVEGALTQYGIPDYLARLAAASDSVMEMPADEPLEDLGDFESVAQELMADLCKDMDEDLVKRHQAELKKKTDNLKEATGDQRAEIISDIGINLMEADKDKIAKDGPKGHEELFTMVIIPIGLEKNAPLVSVKDYFYFPLSVGDEPEELNWFQAHLQYLDLLRERERLSAEHHQQILSALEGLPKMRFTKYFNIFPQGIYEDTVLMAVFSLWQNKALEKLRDMS